MEHKIRRRNKRILQTPEFSQQELLIFKLIAKVNELEENIVMLEACMFNGTLGKRQDEKRRFGKGYYTEAVRRPKKKKS
jgi:hypothetical protein